VLHDTALASALLDRLLHHGDVYLLKGESYRLKDKKLLGLEDVPVLTGMAIRPE
jgi:DNA replication protein DnaC